MEHVTVSSWYNLDHIHPISFPCGYCDSLVGTNRGYKAPSDRAFIAICPNCGQPTFFNSANVRYPGSPAGEPVAHAPEDISRLYNEARQAISGGAYTASVLTCRKILMHVAVEKGAEAGESFVGYVEYLASQGFVPPNARGWLDYIRTRSNEANHEIILMEEKDALGLISFTAMLLRLVYEFPNRVPPAAPVTSPPKK